MKRPWGYQWVLLSGWLANVLHRVRFFFLSIPQPPFHPTSAWGWVRHRLLVGWHLQCRVASCRVSLPYTHNRGAMLPMHTDLHRVLLLWLIFTGFQLLSRTPLSFSIRFLLFLFGSMDEARRRVYTTICECESVCMCMYPNWLTLLFFSK